MKRNVLVVDIGGTHVKLLMSDRDKLKFDSGPGMTPRDFVKKFHETAADLKFAAVSIGFPSVVRECKIVKEPKHLSKGWIGFNFGRALKKPTRVINDAAMQALGGHVRGRMRDHEGLTRRVRVGRVVALFLPGVLPAFLDARGFVQRFHLARDPSLASKASQGTGEITQRL